MKGIGEKKIGRKLRRKQKNKDIKDEKKHKEKKETGEGKENWRKHKEEKIKRERFVEGNERKIREKKRKCILSLFSPCYPLQNTITLTYSFLAEVYTSRGSSYSLPHHGRAQIQHQGMAVLLLQQ